VPKRIIDAVNERASRTDCPFCEAEDWTPGQLVGFPMTEIDLASQPTPAQGPVTVRTLATVVRICGNCGFIRAHSVAPERAFA
jgi:hypothetical protein